MKFKEKYKTGMMFHSEEYPYFDFCIDFVCYPRICETSYEFNLFNIIDWHRTNDKEFEKFIISKGKTLDNTFPYPYWGEMKQKSMDNYIRKYKMKFIGMCNKEVIVYKDDEFEYCSGFKK